MSVFKKSLKLSMAVALLCLSILSLVSCRKKTENGVTVIKVGTGNAYPPYTYQDESGELTGYEKALLDAIDEKLPQYKFKYQVFEFKNILTALAIGNIDIGAHQFEENDERRAEYLFSNEGYNDYTSYIAYLEGGVAYQTLKELEGMTIAITPGSNHAYIIKEYNKTAGIPIKVVYFETSSTDVLIANLETGVANASLLTKSNIDAWNAQRKKKLIASTEPVYVSQAYYLFKKGSIELQQAVDGALRELKQSGKFDSIYKQYITDYYTAMGVKE